MLFRSVARAMFGPVLGVLLVGFVTGFLAYLFTQSNLLAVFAGLLGWVWGAFSSGGSGAGSGSNWRSNTWSSGSSSDSWGGSGSSDDFGSGGGGDFGGGGASGDW